MFQNSSTTNRTLILSLWKEELLSILDQAATMVDKFDSVVLSIMTPLVYSIPVG